VTPVRTARRDGLQNSPVHRRRAGVPLPVGFRITLRDDSRELRCGLWHGGSPPRVLRLSDAGARALAGLRDGVAVHDRASGLVARRFVDAGLAHPLPPAGAWTGAPEVTVVVPAHDRTAELDRCLASLGGGYSVVVVDDASTDECAVRRVAHKHGARVIRLAVNAGPGSARNAGLAAVTTGFVAFADSDTEPGFDWIADLAGHLADPLVAAVAPRIVSAPVEAKGAPTATDAYCRARGSLDLGAEAADVVPYGRVAYVPTAALLVRVATIRAAGGFDEALRVGEDVDLVWRLTAAGHRVRYVPQVRVQHHEPVGWRGLLVRRFRYGRSAAPLAQRHPDSMAPTMVHPWYTGTVLALLARRPVLAAIGVAGTTVSTSRAFSRAGLPADCVHDQMRRGLIGTATPSYSQGYAKSVLRSQTWRSAENSAAYLLAQLRPVWMCWTWGAERAPSPSTWPSG